MTSSKTADGLTEWSNESVNDDWYESMVPEQLMIHIIDDEQSVRESCEFLVNSLGLSTKTWASAVLFSQQVNIYYPAVVISDLMMPEMSGHALQDYLNQHDSPIAMIVLTGNGEIPDAVTMLKKGAADYLEKPISSQRLQEAISAAQVLTIKRAKRYYIRKLYAQLTDKEKQVAHELMQGNLNKVIADHLEVSVRTVEVHRSQVMKKMQAQHVSELIQKLAMLED